MKPIRSLLEPAKKVQVQRQIEELQRHPAVEPLRRKYPDIPEEHWQRSILRLTQYVGEQEHCAACPGLERCPNLLPGYQSELSYEPPYFVLRYKKCSRKTEQEKQDRHRQLIRAHHIPEEILAASFQTIERDLPRLDALNAVLRFCVDFEVGKPMPGIYLYGPMGVGKSHIMGAACRKLAERGISSMMVYVPEFAREMLSAIRDNTVMEKIEALKEVSVLILDDIGAENVSPWFRDEVLGAILQGRVNQGKPTLYTSNLNLDELEAHFAYSSKGELEEYKARRLMERIRHETRAYLVDGINRRAQKWNGSQKMQK